MFWNTQELPDTCWDSGVTGPPRGVTPAGRSAAPSDDRSRGTPATKTGGNGHRLPAAARSGDLVHGPGPSPRRSSTFAGCRAGHLNGEGRLAGTCVPAYRRASRVWRGGGTRGQPSRVAPRLRRNRQPRKAGLLSGEAATPATSLPLLAGPCWRRTARGRRRARLAFRGARTGAGVTKTRAWPGAVTRTANGTGRGTESGMAPRRPGRGGLTLRNRTSTWARRALPPLTRCSSPPRTTASRRWSTS